LTRTDDVFTIFFSFEGNNNFGGGDIIDDVFTAIS
jgi:hypothetical protein